MSKQIITANRLTDGRVVFLTADGAWSEYPAEAATFEGDALAAALARAEADSTTVVGPYTAEVTDGTPIKRREAIRTLGPTVRRDLGKQAGHFADRPISPVSPVSVERT